MDQEERNFYKKLRKQVNNWLEENTSANSKWRDYILLAPDFFYLLAKLSTDPEVPTSKKLKLGAGIAYFISPVDLMPEMFLGPLGFLDDIAVAAYVLNDLINEVDPNIVRKYWAGEQDVLYVIKNVLANANNMLGGRIWNKIKRKF